MNHRPWALAITAVVACADATSIVIAPVVDTPAPGAPGAAFPDLDELVLSIAHRGAEDDLLSATFARGQTVELSGVPEGDDLVVHLLGRLGGTDVAYGRTCPFSITADAVAAPHLYFARTVRWANQAPPSAPDRRVGVADTYHDGSAMFAGGVDGAAQPIGAIDRFDPATGGFAVIATVAPRREVGMVQLGDGREILYGGVDAGGAPSPRIEVLEVDAGDGRRIEVLDDARLALRAAAAATLADGRAMVFGGRAATGRAVGSVVEVSADGVSVALRASDAQLAVARTDATATRLSDDLGAAIAVIGGLDDAGAPVGLLELYKPLRDGFADPASFHPTMRVPRARHHAARLPDGSVLILGGVDATGQPVRRIELFSIDGGFVAAGDLPSGAGLIDATATPLPDGRVLLAGGRTTIGGAPVPAVYIARLNPDAGSIDVIATDPLATARAGHQAALLCDGTVMLVGGADVASAERYNPPPGGRR